MDDKLRRDSAGFFLGGVEAHLLVGDFRAGRRIEQEHDATHELGDGDFMRIQATGQFFLQRHKLPGHVARQRGDGHAARRGPGAKRRGS